MTVLLSIPPNFCLESCEITLLSQNKDSTLKMDLKGVRCTAMDQIYLDLNRNQWELF
jgi:hypothetical protein